MEVTYSVIIPVYNAEKTLPELLQLLGTFFEDKLREPYEIILVDDYSLDNSWAKILELAARDSRIKAVKLARNFGQHNAIVCGLHYSCGKYVITMDDDLQHNPDDILKLINKMEETGADAVIAKLAEKKHRWLKRLASDLNRKLAEIAINKPKGLYLSSFRLIKRQVVDEMLETDFPYPYIPALIFRATGNVVNADVVHRPRKYGASNYSAYKMFKLAGQLTINNRLIMKLIRKDKPAYTVEKVINL
ncbi:glycosyltransferase family 2 protein [Thermincola ferriacetica]